MPHETRLTQDLRHLLRSRRVAALGTLGESGSPMVSMVPFAIDTERACIVIHVSTLAAHTRNLLANPAASLLVARQELAGEPVHALPRVTLEGQAQRLEPGSAAWQTARASYLTRFPEAEPMTQLGDFMFFALQVGAARQIAGFGAARSIDAQALAQVLSTAGA